MSLFRTLLKPQNPLLTKMSLFRTLLKPQNPLCKTLCHRSHPSINLHRNLASTPHPKTTTQKAPNKEPLRLLLQHAIGLRGKTQTKIETAGESDQSDQVRKKLWELEREVRGLNETDSKDGEESKSMERNEGGEEPNKRLSALFVRKKGKEVEMEGKKQGKKEGKPNRSLYGLFSGKSVKKVEMKKKEQEEVGGVFKELSPEMTTFVSHLFKEGYFEKANFLRGDKLDFSCFDNSHGRDFIKFAARTFSIHHQDIAKWLSSSYLKKVALFGCPILTEKTVFAAKTLRSCLKIQEKMVCSKCALKHSCKFVNQTVKKDNDRVLNLLTVMRVITVYALEAEHPELLVPNEVKESVSNLLKEVLKLSQTS